MTVARNLGDYLSAILVDAARNFEIGTRLNTLEERHAYAAAIRREARDMTPAHDPEREGAAIYKRVLDTLDKLADNRGCGTGISANSWRKLKTLALTLARRPDWANLETGPIYGSTNETLANRFHISVDRTRHVLRDLCAFGLIVYHDRLGNGRRTLRRDGNGDPYGHGISLLPLIVKLHALEGIVAAYLDRAKAALRLKRQAVAALRSARQIIPGPNHPAAAALATVDRQISDAFRSRDADALETICSDLEPQKTTLQGVENNPSQYTSQPDPACDVVGRQEARSGNGSAPTSSEDPYGIDAAALKPKEITVLFPVAKHSIEGARDLVDISGKLARQSGLDERMFHRAIRKLGPNPASIAVLVYAQHLADGAIRNVSNPQSYFAGMLNAADRRELNLGATIWGRREITGTHHHRSQN